MTKKSKVSSRLHKERMRRIEDLTTWVKAEKPKIIEWLEGRRSTLDYEIDPCTRKFWYRDKEGKNHNVYFADLPRETKEAIFCRYLRIALRYQIYRDFGFCDLTTLDYIRHVLKNLGCRFYRNRWRCAI